MRNKTEIWTDITTTSHNVERHDAPGLRLVSVTAVDYLIYPICYVVMLTGHSDGF